MSLTTFLQRPVRILIAAAMLASVITGAAFWWKHTPHNTAELIGALDAFTGDWTGEASIEGSNGAILASLPVTRRYLWVGGRQIVETHFHAGTEAYTTRAMQWVENGRLKAVVTGPEDMPHNFVGARTADGILWTNVDRPDSDCLDRIVVRDGHPSMQTASFTNLRLANISGLVGVAAHFKPRAPGEGSPESAVLKRVETRVSAIEQTLDQAAKERTELRGLLARAEQARAAGEAAAAMAARRQASHGNRLQIHSTPAGLAFELHPTGSPGDGPSPTMLEGKTPVTLEALPAGDYAVVLHSAGAPDVVHYVTLRAEGDVVLFHRQITAAGGAECSGHPGGPRRAGTGHDATRRSAEGDLQHERMGPRTDARPYRPASPRWAASVFRQPDRCHGPGR